jgi:DNA-binding NarL/FixJ family response regulator
VALMIYGRRGLCREEVADLLRQGGSAGEVRTAADAPAAVQSLRSFGPDVVLLSLASSDALATLAAIRVAAPTVRVVALAVTETEDEILAYAETGVTGFVPRHGTLETLENTIASVVRGEAVCPPVVTGAPTPSCGAPGSGTPTTARRPRCTSGTRARRWPSRCSPSSGRWAG